MIGGLLPGFRFQAPAGQVRLITLGSDDDSSESDSDGNNDDNISL
jgi:hypothetical protein